MKVLITSGGCKVPIDDVRHIGNFSSGRYGKELVTHFMDAEGKNEVIHFYEKGSLKHEGWDWTPRQIEYKDYYDYLKVKDLIKDEQPDIIISAAAISDYIVDKTKGKISSDNDELIIKLKKGEKVIKSFRELAPNAYIVGFKLLVSPTQDALDTAVAKVFASGVDMVVYNNLADLRNGNNERRVYTRYPKSHPGYPWIREEGYSIARTAYELKLKILSKNTEQV